jgi:hypothetical protein
VRIVFAAVPAYGHLYPLMPLALAAVDAGHDVVVATGAIPRSVAPADRAWHRARVRIVRGPGRGAPPSPGTARRLAELALDILVVVGPQGDVAALGALPPGVRAERFVPQEVVLGQVDLVVHHGGAGTTLGAAAASVPQLLLPKPPTSSGTQRRSRRPASGAVCRMCWPSLPGRSAQRPRRCWPTEPSATRPADWAPRSPPCPPPPTSSERCSAPDPVERPRRLLCRHVVRRRDDSAGQPSALAEEVGDGVGTAQG